MKNPKPEVVLKHLEDVPKMGIVDQTSTGMIYLDIDDDFIWKALEVLRPFGYARPGFFTYPPPPVGAHIKIVTAEEAMDRELLPHKTPESPEPGEHNLYLGEPVDFEVERAYKSQPKLRRYGIVAKYKLKVVSPELEKIRRELTGLAPPKTGFYITLAILIEEIVGPYTDLEDGKNENSLTQKIKEEDLDDEKNRKKGKTEAKVSKEKQGKSEANKSSEEKGSDVKKSKEKKGKSEADKSSENKKSKKKKDDESTDDESTDDEKSESKKTRNKKGKVTRKRDLNTKEDEKVKIKFDDEEEVINKNLLIASIAVNSLTIIVLGFIINSE